MTKRKMFCALIMTKMDLMLLVLTVTSCCFCWRAVGSVEVLRKINNTSNSANSSSNDDGMSQHNITTDAMFAEVSSVASSTTESQGALNTSKTDPLPPSGTKESLDRNKENVPSHRKAKSEDVEKDISSTPSSSSATTSRSTRNGASSLRSTANRDTKLMNLLAARRNAMHQPGQFRTTHRRITNRTSGETPFASTSLSSSKSPNATRSLCERNCTKNFTRRITASCIRRCLAQQKTPNPTPSSSQQARTKVDEKDNNEILETDESSHGFFVIAKDVNDTVNHIGDGVKLSEVSTEKIIRSGAKPTENVDLAPYLYFGQKLPPLRPNRRRNLTSTDSVAVRQPTERGKNWNRSYQTRNFGSYGRFHGGKNVIRPTTTPVFTKPTSESFKDRLVKDDSIEVESSELPLPKEPVGINATETILLRNFTEAPKLADTHEETEVKAAAKIEYTPIIRKVSSSSATSTTILARETTTIATSTSTQTTRFPAESTTTSTSTTTPTSTSVTSTSTTQPTITTTQKEPPTVSFTSSEATFTVNSSETNIPPTESSILEFAPTSSLESTHTTKTEVKPTETTLAPPPPPPPPEEVANMFEPVNEDKPNLIIFYNVTTQPSALSSPNVFTRTTISSSVRSTVNPKVQSPLQTTASVEYNVGSSSPESTTSSARTVPHSSSVFDAVTPSVEDLNGSTVADGEVTIEMKRMNTATYVLIAMGMFPIVIILVYAARKYILKRRYKDDDDLDHFTSDGKPISPVRKMDHLDEDDDISDHYSIVTERDFDRQNLRFKSLLGEGNFGQVWKAEADDLIGHMGTTRIVAVKTVRGGSTQESLKEEAEIMRKLGSHPNVVTILGACLDTEPHLLIMEYAMRGRLLSLLRAARSATNILPASVPGGRSLAPLSPRTLAGFALDIARGMEYISEKKIVHRDLAARNVLLDHNGVCKICDFGMSIDLEQSRNSPVVSKKSDNLQQTQCFDTRFHFDFGGRWMSHWNNNNNEKKHNNDSVSKRPALPIRWMAPEALQYHIFSIKTDVWAFGIVLWELATLGCTPYPNLSGREVIRNVPNGTRPELPQDGRPEFYELMQRCWRKDPQLRPSFRDARNEISRISCKWHDDDLATSDYMDVSGFSEDLEHGMVYFNRRISEFECEI